MYEIGELVAKINPRQTVLLLGAGASVPSGGPSGDGLKRYLTSKLRGSASEFDSYSLAEVCSVFERQLGRRDLARAIKNLLDTLEPTGGLQMLPLFDWYRIYGTNFDQLVEKVFAEAHVELSTKRSNFDFSRSAPPGSVEYFKIHGCISEDVGFGSKSRMLLTEDDYDNYDDFQQASFKALASDLLTKDILIVGQSLGDTHLKEEIKRALKLNTDAGTPGRVFILAFERDENRAQLLQDRGAEVFFGDLDSLLGDLYRQLPPEEVKSESQDSEFAPSLLPAELLAITTDASHAMGLRPNHRNLFNGSPATYADIASGLTFARSVEDRLVNGLTMQPIVVILGAGGVGKTSLARRILVDIGHARDSVWEHNNSFPFEARYWIEFETRLRELGKSAALMVDDCTENLSQVSQLADHLGRLDSPALALILTANTGKWTARSKSKYVYSKGQAQTLSRMSNADLSGLLDLTSQKKEIRDLVDAHFLTASRTDQLRTLRDRCSADMYVCMKNIFASEEIDSILLREFAELDEGAQEIYRHVAALEALGARVHRQLIMRTSSVEAGGLLALLQRLTGVVDEFDISPHNGLYGWETRHRVVATTIAKYKYAQQSDLFALFTNLVENINPAVRLEVETAKALCTEDYGISRLSNHDEQIVLFKAVIDLLPGEGIPRHRLIRTLIDLERLDEATKALADALQAVRMNPVLGRYEVRLLVRKAELTVGIMTEDRIAILLQAEAKALQNLDRNKSDMYAYKAYGDVATAIASVAGGTEKLKAAIAATRKGESAILDPKLTDFRRNMESDLRRFATPHLAN